MNVLSLFDGMSCGQIALNRLGIKYENYFAAEIDKHAISVTKANYPNTQHLGDVTKVKGEDLPKIDLLIGGSPCQGFSFAGKQLNFEDPRSKLFFEYARLLNELKPKYFLLENVRMKKESQDVISKYLGVEPIEINSNLVSAQNRRRLYWTNIPNIEQPADKGILLKDVLEEDVNTKWVIDTNKQNFIETLLIEAKKHKGIYPTQLGNSKQFGNSIGFKNKAFTLRASNPNGVLLCNTETKFRKLTPLECERLQTVPDGYTKMASDTQARRMLGNGWTVDVICHIFKNLLQI